MASGISNPKLPVGVATAMRRFILAYKREGHSIDIEGIQFSSEAVVLEFYPDDDWVGARTFRNLAHMEYTLNEFGESSIHWIDKEGE